MKNKVSNKRYTEGFMLNGSIILDEKGDLIGIKETINILNEYSKLIQASEIVHKKLSTKIKQQDDVIEHYQTENTKQEKKLEHYARLQGVLVNKNMSLTSENEFYKVMNDVTENTANT